MKRTHPYRLRAKELVVEAQRVDGLLMDDDVGTAVEQLKLVEDRSRLMREKLEHDRANARAVVQRFGKKVSTEG